MKPERLYHVSSLAYLSTLVKTTEFRPGAELDFRCEERIRKVLSERGMPIGDIEIALPEEMQHKSEYLLDTHRYFWLTPSLRYAFKKSGKERNRTVYLDTPFSQKYGGAHPIIFAFNGGIADRVQLYGEGHVKHRQVLRLLRALVQGVNFVTPSCVPVSDVEFMMVSEGDGRPVSDFLGESGFSSPIIEVFELVHGGVPTNTQKLEAMLSASSMPPQNLVPFEELGLSFDFF